MAAIPDYVAYELAPGAVNEQVESICKHITDNGSFTNNSQISQTDVDTFISSTYYEIGAWLAEFNLSPTQTAEAVVGVLQYYNALGASARTELALATTGFGTNENNRHRFLWKQYHDGLREIMSNGGLAALGAAELPASQDAGAVTAGGISKVDKQTIEDDSDATKYSFTRDGFDHPQRDTTSIISERSTTSSELP